MSNGLLVFCWLVFAGCPETIKRWVLLHARWRTFDDFEREREKDAYSESDMALTCLVGMVSSCVCCVHVLFSFRLCGVSKSGHDLLPQQPLADSLHDARVQECPVQVKPWMTFATVACYAAWVMWHRSIVICRWKFEPKDSDDEGKESSKCIPYQLQRLFLQLQVRKKWRQKNSR